MTPRNIKESRQSVGAMLLRIRQEKNFTQAQAAILIGVARPQISRIERGICKPNARTAYRIQKAFEATFGESAA